MPGALRVGMVFSWLVVFGGGMGVARAEDPERVLELALDLGLMERGTTGIGPPLLDAGYDQAGGPVAGAGARMLFALGYGGYFHHGVAVRMSHHAGGSFGLTDAYGFAWTAIDLAYAFRTNLPCMSTPDRKLMLTGMLGVSGVNADAGMGNTADPQREPERRAASRELDHTALGPMLGVGLDMHMGLLFVGLALDLRQAFAIGDVPVTRSYVSSAALRIGVALEP